jgi:hypothetical protein
MLADRRAQLLAAKPKGTAKDDDRQVQDKIFDVGDIIGRLSDPNRSALKAAGRINNPNAFRRPAKADNTTTKAAPATQTPQPTPLPTPAPTKPQTPAPTKPQLFVPPKREKPPALPLAIPIPMFPLGPKPLPPATPSATTPQAPSRPLVPPVSNLPYDPTAPDARTRSKRRAFFLLRVESYRNKGLSQEDATYEALRELYDLEGDAYLGPPLVGRLPSLRTSPTTLAGLVGPVSRS